MPELEAVEREYRILSAQICYAEVRNEPVDQHDRARLDRLEAQRIRLSAPRFRTQLAIR